MGLIYADIELINSEDIGMARRHLIDIDSIKRIHLNVLVDTGSYMLAINENIQQLLQLPFIEKKLAETASGEKIWCDVVGPVEVRFKNRSSTTRAMVLPGDLEPLLGAIPLEGMDAVIDAVRQELTVHPERPDYALVKTPCLKPPRIDFSRMSNGSRPPWVKTSGRTYGQ
jgi:clan AA aspartic protease